MIPTITPGNASFNGQNMTMIGTNQPSWYVGYSSNNGYGAEINGIGIQNGTPYYKPTYNYGNVGSNNTTAYKANVAGTANKIAQGGMTKQDIIKYNMKHPNEIAGDPAVQTTSLNSNTAVRS